MGQKDYSEKDLVAFPDVFADIFNVCIYDGKEVIKKENLQPIPTGTVITGDNLILKEVMRDVCMEDVSKGILYLILGIENQSEIDYTMPLRVMGYDYAKYAQQVKKIMNDNKKHKIYTGCHKILKEQKIKPVVTLVLYYGKEETVEPIDLLGMMQMPEEWSYQPIIPYIQNYKMNSIIISKLTKKQLDNFKSDFKCIANYLSNQYNSYELLEKLKKEKQPINHIKETMYVLKNLTNDERFLDITIGKTRKGETDMCELLDIVENRGLEKGIEKGISAFILDNIDEGFLEEKIIEKLVKRFELTRESAKEYYNKYAK